MVNNYFDFNGKRYYTGTVIIVTDHLGKQVEATFICYDVDHASYVYKVNNCRWRLKEEHFRRALVAVTDTAHSDVRLPVVKKKNEFDIEGMFLGWLWYVFLMALSIIFKDRIGLWIMISVIFFSWRSNKIKKEGMYVEW